MTGLNGATATIETGWIVRPGERASFVTGFPAKKDAALECTASPPPVVPDSLKGDARWQAIYELAEEAGRKAMGECVPKPLVVESQVYMEGDCGGAIIVVDGGRTSFARWLKKKDLGDRHYQSGDVISADRIGHSPPRRPKRTQTRLPASFDGMASTAAPRRISPDRPASAQSAS